jgi:deoxyhypusine synthase
MASGEWPFGLSLLGDTVLIESCMKDGVDYAVQVTKDSEIKEAQSEP